MRARMPAAAARCLRRWTTVVRALWRSVSPTGPSGEVVGVSACPKPSPTPQTGLRRLPGGSYVLEPPYPGGPPLWQPPLRAMTLRAYVPTRMDSP